MGAIPNRISMIPCCCNPIPFGMIVNLYGMEPVPNRISIIPRGSKAIPFGIWPNQRSFRLCRSDSEGFHWFLKQTQKRFHSWFLFYRLMFPVFCCNQPVLSCFLLCVQLQFLARHPAAFLFPVFSYRLVAKACFVHPHPEVAENTDGAMGCREKFSASGGYQNKKSAPG